ncbi:zinc finger BED domain-containing protein 4-like [Eupeodes corollae]|uniref:zinc finger BED domain-containing protein 4-like n=1 Tax=Eupeodes corollae TaxID=290404 RepID=UPI002493707D|nr:zinc finger BED domain-containing protein 4-like [Eupeodes corollae]
MEFVDIRLQSIKDQIRKMTKGRILSLKIDCATRLDRSILGINLQFIELKKDSLNICVKTLGMVQLFERHTGQLIKEKILEILSDFQIDINQIYSITSDNGRNMLKAVEILNETSEMSEELDLGVEEIVDSITLPNIQSIRCAAHTLQLCVNDINKDINICQKIETARKLSQNRSHTKFGFYNKLKHLLMSCSMPTICRRILLQSDNCIPPLDVSTRWNSTYRMLQKLLEIKSFLMEQQIFEDTVDWQWIQEYVETLKPIWIATLKMQEEQLVLGVFFKIWMELKLHYENASSDLKIKLKTALNEREGLLLESVQMLSAIYFDPRISLNITSVSQEANPRTSNESPNTATSQASDTDNPLLNLYLNRIEQQEREENGTSDVSINETLTKLYVDIENFDSVYPRLPLDTNILTFFQNLKLKSPNIFEIAMVVLGVPATQVSVERAFSSLSFILSERRYNLNSKTLESLLLVRLNN